MKIKEFFKAIGIGLIGGILGAYGGAEKTSKLWRRLGIPILITLIALVILKQWLVLSIMSLYAVLTIGYGIPDVFDDGSSLGKFWYGIFMKYFPDVEEHFFADIFTRGTVGILSCLTFLSIPIIKSNWITYILGSIVVISIFAFLSWRTLGSIKLFGKYLTWSEIIPYSALTTFAMLLIF